MGWNNLHQKARKLLNSSPTLKESFHLITITLLSLLLPLSFLLVARLACVNYILNAVTSNPSQSSTSFLFSFYFHTNPASLYLFVSVVGIVTLIHGLTGEINSVSEPTDALYRPRLYTAWIVLCILLVSVGLGIEESIESGFNGAGFGVKRSLLSRIIFFLGLHETMLLWFRTIVKPVVDDAIFGAATQERWVHRAAIAVSVGSFWWWKLRDEVESLVVVAEAKKELSMKIKMADFLGWWLYYLTVTIGMVRLVKVLLSLGNILLCRRVRRDSIDETTSEEDQDKV